MVEKYFNVKPYNKLDKTIFDPDNFIKRGGNFIMLNRNVLDEKY